MEWQAVPIGDRIASSLALPPVPYNLTLRLFELEKGPRDAITKEMRAWIDAHAPELRKAPDASQARHAATRLVTEHSLRYSDHPDKLVSSLLLALRDPQSPGHLPPANFEGFLQALIPELEVALIGWDTFDSICNGVSQGLKGVATWPIWRVRSPLPVERPRKRQARAPPICPNSSSACRNAPSLRRPCLHRLHPHRSSQSVRWTTSR